MQYEPALGNDLWGLAIIPGAASWVVIQSAPLELLGERAPGARRNRLADLCRALSCAAFQINIYDGTGKILVEVSKDGDVVVSGLNLHGPGDNPYEWNGERIPEDRVEALFRVLPYQTAFDGVELAEKKAYAIAERFGGRNAAYCDNIVSVDTLISHKPLLAPGAVALYFKWTGPTRQTGETWNRVTGN